MGLFFIEVTDTFGGEANYCWVTRHVVRANTIKGAIWRFSRKTGISWRYDWNDGECAKYNSVSGATCFFISNFDPEYHGEYHFDTDERA